MCINPYSNSKTIEKVVCYKIFAVRNRKLRGFVYNTYHEYEIGQTYESKEGPGFQAFVSKTDAERVVKKRGGFPKTRKVVRVILHNAVKGLIDNMSVSANGKEGYIAPTMSIPGRKRNKK